MLDIALRAAVAGRGQVIALTGEPGIGKTRLVQESRKRFIAWVGAGSGRRPLWLEGRCASYASATPYGLYRQLIASWIGVALDQPPARIRAALADALTRLFGNTNLLTPLASLMGLPQRAGGNAGRISPEELQRQTFAAVRALVARFAAVGPDRARPRGPALGRPDLAAPHRRARGTRRGPAAAADRHQRAGRGRQPPCRPPARSALRPLAADAAEALATSLLGKVGGPQVLAAALASADGNPLFLEERLAEMLEAGTLVEDQGTWRLREPAGPAAAPVARAAGQVPGGPAQPGRRRRDQGRRGARHRVHRGLLAAMLGTTPAALAPVLDRADRQRPRAPTRRTSRAAFLFRHALIQEATYLALLRAERRDLHARAARAIEAAASDRLPRSPRSSAGTTR